jgi:hypothetical protein
MFVFWYGIHLSSLVRIDFRQPPDLGTTHMATVDEVSACVKYIFQLEPPGEQLEEQ